MITWIIAYAVIVVACATVCVVCAVIASRDTE